MAEMNRPSGAHAVVTALLDEGVTDVFGIPGTHNIEIYRHVAESGINHVTPRHEQGGGYAADAYARVTGSAGVVIATTGPGVTNTVTAAATAYADSIPMLVISPGMPESVLGRDIGWLHEMKDQQGHLDAVVDRSVRVSSAAAAYDAVREVFARWRTERPRPVHIEVPVNILDGGYDPTELDRSTRPPAARKAPDADIAKAAAALDVDKPLLIVGGGATRASEEVRQVAEHLQAPVVTTVNGKGVLPESHPLSLGASIRLDAAQDAITKASALLVVGAVLGDAELWGQTVKASGPVVRIDRQAAQLQKNLAVDHPLHEDAADALRALLGRLSRPDAGWTEAEIGDVRERCRQDALRDGAAFAPYHEVLRAELRQDAVICGDSAQLSYFGTAHMWPAERPGQFPYPATFATLGYAIPAAVGAAVAAPERQVVAFAGDGGSMFTVQEFATAVDLRRSLPVIIYNNGGFEEIRADMISRGVPPLGVAVRSPDFPALGKALGGYGVRVESADGLADALRDALAADAPTMIEIAAPVPAS